MPDPIDLTGRWGLLARPAGVSVCVRAVVLVVVLGIVAGCAAPPGPAGPALPPYSAMVPSQPLVPPSQSAAAVAPPAAKPPTVTVQRDAAAAGSLADPQIRQRLTSELAVRGWRAIGSTGGGEGLEPSLVYALLGAVPALAPVARVWTLTVLSAPRAQTERVAALGVQSEYDCGRQTVRPISRARYRDRLGVDRDSLIQIEGGTASPIAPGTVSAQVFNLVCGGRPSSGSGVVVASDRVLTNHHVVAACAQVQVVQEGRRVGARVIAQDPRHDLALLEALTVAPKGRGALALRRIPVTGESVMVAGFPLAGLLGQDIVVTTGIVNAQSGVRNDQTQIQISAPVQPGNSGGPLLDKSGRLVGLVVSKLNALRTAATTGDIAQNVNFAIKPEIVRAFAQTHGVAMGAVDAGERMETEDLAVRARDVTVKIECTGARPGGTAGVSPGAV